MAPPPPATPPRFSAVFLARERMSGSPRTISWRFEHFDQLDSTNRFAAARILAAWDAGASPEGIVITAARQTAGRGQHGRRWESPAGGLYFSAVVENIPPEFRDRLALVAGLAVANNLRDRGVPAMIRWPNDVLIADKKLAGILCEALARGQNWAAIIGIGVNLTTNPASFPPDLQKTATSLIHHLPGAPDGNPGLLAPNPLARSILNHLSTLLAALSQEGLAPILDEIRPLDALAGKQIRFQTSSETFTATARGLDPNGSLLLARSGEPPHPFPAGTVVAIIDDSLHPMK